MSPEFFIICPRNFLLGFTLSNSLEFSNYDRVATITKKEYVPEYVLNLNHSDPFSFLYRMYLFSIFDKENISNNYNPERQKNY